MRKKFLLFGHVMRDEKGLVCEAELIRTDVIVENIGDTVDILKVIKPVYNFKAGK